MVIKMNDSLDLRNRILKMRENNNLNVTKQDSLKNNLMSEFENSIQDDNKKERDSHKETITDQNKEILLNSTQNNSENLVHHKDKTENQNINRTVNDNDAQFLMLANKFNEAVEVILELSQKVEMLERNASQNKNIQKNKVKSSSLLNFKMLVFIMLIPIMLIGFFTIPFDFLLLKSIIIDILSSL